MTRNETIRLIEVLLRDLRGSWRCYNTRRARLAEYLCRSLNEDSFNTLADRCRSFYQINDTDSCDGRYFRAEFPYGYEEMEKLYDEDFDRSTLEDKSDEFKAYVKEYVVYPSTEFDDFPEEEEFDDWDIKIDERRNDLLKFVDLSKIDNLGLVNKFLEYIDCNKCPCSAHCHPMNDDSFNSCEDAWLLYLTGRLEKVEVEENETA